MRAPYLTFHDIASVSLGPIRDFVKGDPHLTGEPFCKRDLMLTTVDGTTYVLSLFAAKVEQVQPTVDATIDRYQPKPVLTTVSQLAKAMDSAAAKAHDDAGNTPPPALNPKTGKLVPW